MQTIEERDVDKSSWPAGPWIEEPDKKQWQDAATGLPCLIVRHPRHGNLCGYVGVPQSHPLHGKSYSERVPMPAGPDAVQNTSEAKPVLPLVCEALREPDGMIGLDSLVDVHGGLTYADKCGDRICHEVDPGEDDNIWWFGFDCAHGGDLSPGHTMFGMGGKYRDFDYVSEECRKLAAQLAALAAQSE